MNIRNQISREYAFTLVETLVAIAILMIAIAGPLVVASKSLAAALYAKDQSTATFLAQEAMEEVRNVKDSLVVADPANAFGTLFPAVGTTVNGTTMAGCRKDGVATRTCGIAFDDTAPFLWNDTCAHMSGCVLYYDATGADYRGYFHVSLPTGSQKPTKFTRYFYYEQIPFSQEVRVTVIVTWYEGTLQNSISLTDQMTNVAL